MGICCFRASEELSLTCNVLYMDTKTVHEIPLGEQKTISHLKTELSKIEQIPKSEIRLFMYGKAIPDTTRLSMYGLEFKMNQFLSMRRQQSNQIEIMVHESHYYMLPSKTIYELKKKIEANYGVEPEEQILSIRGEELRDTGSLESNNIRDGDKINLKALISFKVVHMGEEREVEYWSNIYISEVVDYCMEVFKLSIRPVLMIENCVLEGGEYVDRITAKGRVRVIKHKGYPVYIKSMNGAHNTVIANPQMTIADLKWQMADKYEVSIHQIRFLFAGKQLLDEWDLHSCNVIKESTLHMILRRSDAD